MKRLFFIGALALMAFSCKPDAPEVSSLEVSAQEIVFDADGGSEALNITSNTSWTITGGKGWLEVSPSTGDGSKVVVLSVSENTALKERECNITVTTDDAQVMQRVTIIQEATPASLVVDVNEITLAATNGSSRSFNIKSNDSWTITGCPEWLNLSTKNASGDVTVTIEALTTNYSAQDRSAVLTVQTASLSCNVTVIQKAAWLSNCTAMPVEMTVLYDCAGFVWEFVGDVAYYYYGVLEKTEADRMTPVEIVEYLVENGDRDTPGDNYISSVNDLDMLTDYILYAVAYNKDGVQGDLYAVPFKTKTYINQPHAAIQNVQYDSSYWYWETVIGPYATCYHMWAAESYGYNLADGVMAYIVKRGIDEDPNNFPKIVQNGEWQFSRSENSIHIITWGRSVEGELGGYIERFRGTIKSSSVTSVPLDENKVTSVSFDEYKKISEGLVRIY